MKSKDDLLWNRSDTLAYAMLLIGLALLLAEMGLFINHYNILAPYLNEMIPLYVGIFAIPTLFMIGGAVIYRMTAGKFERMFPLMYTDTTRLVEAVLKRRGLAYSESTSQHKWFASLRPRIIITVERWGIRMEVQGLEQPSKILGPFSRVYVGKITKKNRAEIKTLLREISNAGKTSTLGG